MSKSTTWTIIIVVVLVILGISLTQGEKEPQENDMPGIEGEQGEVENMENEPEDMENEAEENEPEDMENEPEEQTPSKPKQSSALDESEIPEDSVQLSVSATGFEPNEFDVDSGAEVTLAVTSTDKTHVFKFDDPDLQGIAIGLAGNETRTITFTAPEKGDYTFYCDVPGHRARGETGVMHVK